MTIASRSRFVRELPTSFLQKRAMGAQITFKTSQRALTNWWKSCSGSLGPTWLLSRLCLKNSIVPVQSWRQVANNRTMEQPIQQHWVHAGTWMGDLGCSFGGNAASRLHWRHQGIANASGGTQPICALERGEPKKGTNLRESRKGGLDPCSFEHRFPQMCSCAPDAALQTERCVPLLSRGWAIVLALSNRLKDRRCVTNYRNWLAYRTCRDQFTLVLLMSMYLINKLWPKI